MEKDGSGVEKGLTRCKKRHVSPPEDSDGLKYNHCRKGQLGSGARRTKEPAEAFSPEGNCETLECVTVTDTIKTGNSLYSTWDSIRTQVIEAHF